jgi:hypothetical protein
MSGLSQINRISSGVMVLVGISMLALGSCQPMPRKPPQPITKLAHLPVPPVLTPPILSLPTPDDLPPMSTPVRRKLVKPPTSYVAWIRQRDYRKIQHYSHFLDDHGIKLLPPMHELLVSARDWEVCGREQYQLPPRELWEQMVPTLKVLDQLQQQAILTSFEITSSYRDPELNSCAGGSLGSKHIHNAAIDIRLTDEQGGAAMQQRIHEKLCDFWIESGERYQLGLGLYASGQIHIDTEGYRTWGPDYTRNTSICAGRGELLAKKD